MTAADLMNISVFPGLPIVFPILSLLTNLHNELPKNDAKKKTFKKLKNSSMESILWENKQNGLKEDEDIFSILLELDSAEDEFFVGKVNETMIGVEYSEEWENATNGRNISAKNRFNETLPQIDKETTLLPEPAENAFRLPKNIRPIKYELRLTLDSETDIIQGQVKIEIQCLESTNLIRLNVASDFMQLDHITLESRLQNRSIPIRSINLDWRRQQLSLFIADDSPIKAGDVHYLSIWYSAHYSNDAHGFSRRMDKKRRIWLNSLFEPSFARTLFPCWDEPLFRSSFRLELWLLNGLAAEDYFALSSTDGHCRRWHANLSICQFESTPPIPTYLFTLAVGRFNSVCSTDLELEIIGASKICIWKLADGNVENDWADRAQLIITKMVEFQAGMMDYLLADPGARLHLLIVPMMKINGMENWGLLNVREYLWPMSNESQQRFEKTLFHEMAHQWFGNLVTIQWWDSIWIAESLANFLSTPRPIVFDASTDLSDTALVDAEWAMESAEGGFSAIPGIVYTKGAALIEMLDSLIGAEKMQKLLRKFTRTFQFKSANTQDFLALLDDIMDDKMPHSPSNRSMAVHFLDRWLQLPSHPIVFADFDPQLGQLFFSQMPKMPMGNLEQQKWPIPIWVECLEGTIGEQLLWIPDGDPAQLVVPLQNLTRTNSTQSLAFNLHRSVYYQFTFRNRPKH